jgi:hypothetical protein
MDPRESDLLKTQLDLVELSNIDNFTLGDHEELEEVEESIMNPVAASVSNSSHQKSSGGFCVKDYEERLEALKKENFNLKLRIYFLEEKNPNIPLNAENMYKEIIDLKVNVLSICVSLFIIYYSPILCYLDPKRIVAKGFEREARSFVSGVKSIGIVRECQKGGRGFIREDHS